MSLAQRSASEVSRLERDGHFGVGLNIIDSIGRFLESDGLAGESLHENLQGRLCVSVLNFGPDIVDSIRGINIESDRLAGDN